MASLALADEDQNIPKLEDFVGHPSVEVRNRLVVESQWVAVESQWVAAGTP